MTAETLFYYPRMLSFNSQIWLLLPMCAAVTLVYKTVRTQSLRRLPQEALAAFAYVLGGLAVLGAALWLLQEYWP